MAIETVRMCKDDQPDSDVHPTEVENWKATGWRLLYSEVDAIEQSEAQTDEVAIETPEVTSTTPIRCTGITRNGNQCARDAVKGGKFCALHK